jgi:hypothetical protein
MFRMAQPTFNHYLISQYLCGKFVAKLLSISAESGIYLHGPEFYIVDYVVVISAGYSIFHLLVISVIGGSNPSLSAL